jgi:hypothetical protein
MGQYRTFLSSTPHDERYVNLIFFVVEAERVHQQIDAKTHRHLALRLAAWVDLEVVAAKIIA